MTIKRSFNEKKYSDINTGNLETYNDGKNLVNFKTF